MDINKFLFFYVAVVFIFNFSCNQKHKDCNFYIEKAHENENSNLNQNSFCEGVKAASSDTQLKILRLVEIPNVAYDCKYWNIQMKGIKVVEVANVEPDFLNGFNTVMATRIEDKYEESYKALMESSVPNNLLTAKDVFKHLENRISTIEYTDSIFIKIDTTSSMLVNFVDEIYFNLITLNDSLEVKRETKAEELIKGKIFRKNEESLIGLEVNLEKVSYERYCKGNNIRVFWHKE